MSLTDEDEEKIVLGGCRDVLKALKIFLNVIEYEEHRHVHILDAVWEF